MLHPKGAASRDRAGPGWPAASSHIRMSLPDNRRDSAHSPDVILKGVSGDEEACGRLNYR